MCMCLQRMHLVVTQFGVHPPARAYTQPDHLNTDGSFFSFLHDTSVIISSRWGLADVISVRHSGWRHCACVRHTKRKTCSWHGNVASYRNWAKASQGTSGNFSRFLVAEFCLLQRVHLCNPSKKLIVVQLVNNFPVFCGTRRIFTVFTEARIWSLSYGGWFQLKRLTPYMFNIRFNIIISSTVDFLRWSLTLRSFI